MTKGRLIGTLVVLLATNLQGGLLYFTDFENFAAGPDNWVGPPDAWTGNSTGVGAHGISDGIVRGEGKTGYLGLNQPTTTLVSLAKTLDHDIVAGTTSRIQIDTLVGITNSTNLRYDSFFVSVLDNSGHFLAGIRFDNAPATFGIWREDGATSHDTGEFFIHGEPGLLCMLINPYTNSWSADFNGIPLFINKPFTVVQSGPLLTFHALAFEWLVFGTTPAEHGDNWLMVADCAVWDIPPGDPNFGIEDFTLNAQGEPTLHFTTEPGWSYQVEYSGDGVSWADDLPNSSFAGGEVPASVVFTDTTHSPPSVRFYRLVRTVTP